MMLQRTDYVMQVACLVEGSPEDSDPTQQLACVTAPVLNACIRPHHPLFVVLLHARQHSDPSRHPPHFVPLIAIMWCTEQHFRHVRDVRIPGEKYYFCKTARRTGQVMEKSA